MLLLRHQIHSLKGCENNNRATKIFNLFFEKYSKYVGVTKSKTSRNKQWQATLSIGKKKQYLGCFKTEIAAAKCVNFVCKKESMKIKNPELSDEEPETFIWPLPSRKVAIF